MKLMINETSYSGLDYWRTDSHLNPRHTVVAAENRSGFANQRWSQLCVPVLNWASRLTKNEERIETSTAAHLYQKTVALCVCVWKSKKKMHYKQTKMSMLSVCDCAFVWISGDEREKNEKRFAGMRLKSTEAHNGHKQQQSRTHKKWGSQTVALNSPAVQLHRIAVIFIVTHHHSAVHGRNTSWWK